MSNVDRSTIVDALSTLADSDTQRLAARMAQEAFAATFRLAADPDPAKATQAMADTTGHCRNWCEAGASEEARALRLALLISGLDQWGLAYSQAFNLTAIPTLSTLLGALRSGLETRRDALFQFYFSQIEQIEQDAIDFKVDLRRGIHLALWHAMAACETDSAAEPVIQALGSLLLAVDDRMPELGWRLVADALASIQISLLNNNELPASAQESTRKLLESLRQALPAERYQTIMAHATHALINWQQARRSPSPP